MSATCRFGWLAASLVVVGCSASSRDHPSPVLDPGPHRGALRKIDGADGFIEVVTEPIRDAPSGTPKFRVAIYWLDHAQTGVIRPMPTDVTMTAAWPDAPTPQALDLTIDPVPGDPAGAAKFVAPAADHRGEPTGTVRAKMGNDPISAPL